MCPHLSIWNIARLVDSCSYAGGACLKPYTTHYPVYKHIMVWISPRKYEDASWTQPKPVKKWILHISNVLVTCMISHEFSYQTCGNLVWLDHVVHFIRVSALLWIAWEHKHMPRVWLHACDILCSCGAMSECLLLCMVMVLQLILTSWTYLIFASMPPHL
jgi:hypothetical protein